MIAIRAGRALLGTELEEVHDAVILCEDDRITAAGKADDIAIPGHHRLLEAPDLTVLPGFIDAHVHIGFANPVDVVSGGVTTARDLAWPEDIIWPLVELSHDPSYLGPHLVAVGPMLTVEGGYPTSAGWAPPGTGRVVSGPADARATVEDIATHDPAAIKVALNPDVGPTLDADTLQAIVESAHALDLIVTGHVTGLAELDKALDAGMDELAHMLMSEESIPDDRLQAMVSTGMTVVPTLSCRFDADLELAIDNTARFLRLGGRVVYGTDLGNEGPQPGIDHREIQAMVAAGMAGHQIVASATTVAAGHLGVDAGVLGPGRRADVIGVVGDPLNDPLCLVSPSLVVRGGRVVTEP